MTLVQASHISSPPLPSVPLSGPGSPGSVNLVAPSTPSFVISVGDPQTIGSSLNIAAQHTVYTVRTRVSPLLSTCAPTRD